MRKLRKIIMEHKTGIQWAAGVSASILLIFAILISSFEIAMYQDFGYYEKEYIKYQVTEDLNMELSDVMQVTHEMMAYLRGERSDLVVYTTIDGVEHQEFFNDQDKVHMADVQHLFLGGLQLRRVALIFALILFLVMLALKGNWKYILPRTVQIGMGVFAGLTAFLGVACAINFNAVFTKFHEIFFTNDLWIFDPATDYMINMLPEGFFFDMVIRIGSFFIGGLLILLILSIIGSKVTSHKKQERLEVTITQKPE